MRIVEELISFYRHIYLNLPGVTRLVGVAGAGAALRFGVFPANLYKLGEPTSGLEPLSCSYRSGLLMSQRIDSLYPPRETSEPSEASWLLPVGLKCLAERLLQ
jgi:hypothetical protein